MALIKCKECGTEVSDKAKSCVKCGAPIEKEPTATQKVIGGVVLAGLVIGGVVWLTATPNGQTKPDTDSASTQSSCAKTDLQCLGDKGVVGAGIYCKEPVEHLAAHSVKWTDGTLETKFSRFRWLDQTTGSITYVGDKAQFQNGFGAYTNVVYECDMAADDKTVLAVRVSEGFLQ